jgi:hypothetical protein
VNAIGLDEYVRHRADYVDTLDELETLEFVAPGMHYASGDTTAYPACCLDWRAEIRLAVADAHAVAPDVVVGAVGFLILQLGREPVELVLQSFSADAERFAELFDGPWVSGDIKDGAFGAAASIDVVLIILDAAIADVARGHRLGAWAVSKVIATMLPTSAGLAVMYPHREADPDHDIAVSKLQAVERFDRYWRQVGLQPIDGHSDSSPKPPHWFSSLLCGHHVVFFPTRATSFETGHLRHLAKIGVLHNEPVHWLLIDDARLRG